METDGKIRGILTAAVPFVLSRRKETGGFGATLRLISWFRATRYGDGGFGFFPGTTSFTIVMSRLKC